MEQPSVPSESRDDDVSNEGIEKLVRVVQETSQVNPEKVGIVGEGDPSVDCGLRRRFVSIPDEVLDRPNTTSSISLASESTSDDSFKASYDERRENVENVKLGSVSRRILEPDMPNRDQPPKMKKRKKREESRGTIGTVGTGAASAASVEHGEGVKYTIQKLWKTGDEFKVPLVDRYPVFVIRDFVIYLIFMIIVCTIVFGSRGTAYNYYSDVIRRLVTSSFYNSSLGLKVSFSETLNQHDMWTFIVSIVCKLLYNRTYSGSRDGAWSGIRVQTDNIVFGAPQLRQLRVRRQTCTAAPMFESLYNDCIDYYSEEIEDKHDFGLGTSAWRYNEPHQDRSYFDGKVSTYPQGGFVMNFTEDENFTLNYIAELQNENWVGFETRVVFLDFALFNPNTHLFCVCKLIFELPPFGGILPSYRFSTLRLLRYVDPWDFFILSCEVIFICFTLYYTFEESLQIYRLRETYLLNWWNILDITIIICSYYAIICGFISVTTTRKFVTQNVVNIHTTNHVSFDKVVDIQSRFDLSLAILVFVVWLKIFKFSTLNRTVEMVLAAIVRSGPTLIVVTIMMTTIMIGFAIFGFVLFGSTLHGFKHVGNGLFTMLRLVTGGIHWYKKDGTSNFWMKLYAIVYFVSARVMFLNLYVALIVSGFEEEVREHDELCNTATIGDVFRELICKFLIFIRQEKIASNIYQREVLKQNMKIYDALVGIIRRHGYDSMETDLILEKHQVTYGLPIDKDAMAAIYDEINVRNQLSLEVKDHNKLKEQIEQMDKNILVIDQTLMGMMTKVDILTNRYIQKKASSPNSS